MIKEEIDVYTVQKSNNADSRTATSKREENLMIDTIKHIKDVQSVMSMLAMKLIKNSIAHDYTKIESFDSFYNDWSADDGYFMNKEWYKHHVMTERHHSSAFVHDDYNLLDLLEEVVDKVCAGKGRSGKINFDYLICSDEVLRLAFNNTIILIDKMTHRENTEE